MENTNISFVQMSILPQQYEVPRKAICCGALMNDVGRVARQNIAYSLGVLGGVSLVFGVSSIIFGAMNSSTEDAVVGLVKTALGVAQYYGSFHMWLLNKPYFPPNVICALPTALGFPVEWKVERLTKDEGWPVVSQYALGISAQIVSSVVLSVVTAITMYLVYRGVLAACRKSSTKETLV